LAWENRAEGNEFDVAYRFVLHRDAEPARNEFETFAASKNVKMEYFLSIIFSVFVLAQIYIVRMNRKATVKRKAFRWWLAICGAFLAVHLSIVVSDKILLIFVFPVLAGVLFGLARFTKFCDWCGRMIQTNLPFGEKNKCPRCGSTIS
jgi:hypothetical protein